MNMLNNILNLNSGQRHWIGLIALFIGFFIVLLSTQLYINLGHILSPAQQEESQYDYLVINKKITNSMMGNNAASYFTTDELSEIAKAPTVEDMTSIVPNQFPIAASTGGELQFYTQLFFESIPKAYLDIKPSSWTWQEGQQQLPVILSADFLNLYNFGFALSQNLPQLSEETIQALSFELTIGEGANAETYQAEVAGFSHRYSSVLVPESFMHYANSKFGNNTHPSSTRVVIKTKEPSNTKLVNFLREHDYSTQEEKLKMSKVKSILNWIFAAIGIIGLFILILSFMMLRLFLELNITRSGERLKLLSILGFKPRELHRVFTVKTTRLLMVIMALCLFIISAIQFALKYKLEPLHYTLSPILHWSVWMVAILLPVGVYYMLHKRVIQLIKQYY